MSPSELPVHVLGQQGDRLGDGPVRQFRGVRRVRPHHRRTVRLCGGHARATPRMPTTDTPMAATMAATTDSMSDTDHHGVGMYLTIRHSESAMLPPCCRGVRSRHGARGVVVNVHGSSVAGDGSPAQTGGWEHLSPPRLTTSTFSHMARARPVASAAGVSLAPMHD